MYADGSILRAVTSFISLFATANYPVTLYRWLIRDLELSPLLCYLKEKAPIKTLSDPGTSSPYTTFLRGVDRRAGRQSNLHLDK